MPGSSTNSTNTKTESGQAKKSTGQIMTPSNCSTKTPKPATANTATTDSSSSTKTRKSANRSKSHRASATQSLSSKKRPPSNNDTAEPPSNDPGGRSTLDVNQPKLEEFAIKAQTIKADINKVLEEQARHLDGGRAVEIEQLKRDIMAVTADDGLEPADKDGRETNFQPAEENATKDPESITKDEQTPEQASLPSSGGDNQEMGYKSDMSLKASLNEIVIQSDTCLFDHNNNEAEASNAIATAESLPELELLSSKMDGESKLFALKSALQQHFTGAPELLDPICRKFVLMSSVVGDCAGELRETVVENRKLRSANEKLQQLCRELQKSNNSIRIESLDLIKSEQLKAKEQTCKIQSTLSGVIKLFDDNQQRNQLLRQENAELQSKLKGLLEHCDDWEKSVQATLKQRDIETKLLKAELAKANLISGREFDRLLSENKWLLEAVQTLQKEKQSQMEAREAKLRSDLSHCATKYDEYQEIINKGMREFQAESKRMLDQIEKSKHDYKILLGKYEAINKRMVQLLEEKQTWSKTIINANRKIETLEKLCRAMQAKNNVDTSCGAISASQGNN